MESDGALGFAAEWGLLALSILLVFSPFIYLGIRKWKHKLPVNLTQVIAAYISAVSIYIIWNWWMLDFFDTKIPTHVFIKFFVIQLGNASYKMMFVFTVLLTLSTFFSAKLIAGKFTLSNFIIALLAGIGIFAGSLYAWMYVIGWGLGQIGANYF